MKSRILYTLLIFSLFCVQNQSASAQAKKPELFLKFCSRWDNNHLNRFDNQTFNDIWGYHAPDGREYAIFGSLDSTYFIEVTDPYHPVVRDAEAGKYNATIHRDFKTYSHYAYGVADEGFSSLQIFDLQYLPDSVHKVYDSDSLVVKSHNIFIEGNRLYVCAHKFWNDKHNNIDECPMSVLSLADPEHPSLIAHIEPQYKGTNLLFDYVHDVFVRHDTAYMSTGITGLFIYDLHDPAKPKFIQSITPPYPGNGYNHSGWLSADGNHYVFADETWYSPLKMVDVSAIKNPANHNPTIPIIGTFGSNNEKGSIVHNPFIKDNYIYTSYYQEGVVVFDMTNPDSVKKVAQYDTCPENDTISHGNIYSGYNGCWGVYPFLPSGTIIALDMNNGLFVLKLDTFPVYRDSLHVRLISNPMHDIIRVQVGFNMAKPFQMSLYDVQGKLLASGKFNGMHGDHIYQWHPDASIRNGMYLLEIRADDTRRVVKIALVE